MANKKDKIIGIRALEEALNEGTPINKVLLQSGGGEGRQALQQKLNAEGVPYQKVPKAKLNRESSGNHQGVVAFTAPVEYHSLEGLLPTLFESGKTPFIAVLDGITDVRNFGAIARSAECFGVHALVIPAKGGSLVNEDAVKTSAGALLRLPVCREFALGDSLEYLKQSGIRLYGISEKGEQSLPEVDFQNPSAVVLGSEDQGISSSVMEKLNALVSIPMQQGAGVGSLNVSVAAGIVFYAGKNNA